MQRLSKATVLVGLFATAVLVSSPTLAGAISHANKLKAPLAEALPRCLDDFVNDDYCDQAGALDLDSPWQWSQGTVVWGGGVAGLRLDDIELKPGESCPVAGTCRCWQTGKLCTDVTDCDTGGAFPDEEHCGPSGTEEDIFSVEIYMQGVARQGFGIPTSRVRRDVTCSQTIGFTPKNSGQQQNRRIDSQVSAVTECRIYWQAGDPHSQIRLIEVRDNADNVLGVLAPE